MASAMVNSLCLCQVSNDIVHIEYRYIMWFSYLFQLCSNVPLYWTLFRLCLKCKANASCIVTI